MGEPNIGSETRDLVAEIICNAMTPNQRSGGVTEKHYAVADAVLAAIGSLDATGDLIQRAADEYGEVRFQAVCTAEGEPDGAYWAKVVESETKRVVFSGMSDSPIAAIMAALAAAEDGR